jgi:hypothetical protein
VTTSVLVRLACSTTRSVAISSSRAATAFCGDDPPLGHLRDAGQLGLDGAARCGRLGLAAEHLELAARVTFSCSTATTRRRFCSATVELAVHVLLSDRDLLVGGDAGLLDRSRSSCGRSRRWPARAPARLDRALLAARWRRPPALQLEQRLLRLDVLALDVLALVVAQLVGEHVLRGGQLGDQPDALAVEDVLRVERGQRRLLEVVDRDVGQQVAREVRADDLDDAVAELLPLGVEVGELDVPTRRLQRLGELRLEQLVQLLRVGGRAVPTLRPPRAPPRWSSAPR